MRRVLLAFAVGVFVTAQSHGFDFRSRVGASQIDGKGWVWVTGHPQDRKLHVFNGRDWSEASVSFGPEVNARPDVLAAMRDGSVACIWTLSENTLAVSYHADGKTRLITESAGVLPKGEKVLARPFCDSRNRLWITGKMPQIWRVDPSGDAKVVYELAEADMTQPSVKGARYNPTLAVEDGRGRIWIWTNSRHSRSSERSLEGFLLCQGEKIERKILPGFEGALFGPVFRRDKQHMWVSVLADGLYEVHIDTFKARLIEEPVAGAFRDVESIFAVGRDTYVVAVEKSEGKLWRLREGKWRCLIESIDDHFDFERPWVADGTSLVLGAYPSCWIVRGDGKAERLKWEDGFDIENPQNLFRLRDGRIFAQGKDGSMFCGKPDPKPVASRIEELSLRSDCALDASGRVWCVRNNDKLGMWTGKEWTEYPLPDSPFIPKRIQQLVADAQGRIWLLSSFMTHAASFYDTREHKWHVFKSLEAAFLNVIADPPKFIEPKGGPRYDPFFRPVYSKGKVACLTSWDSLAFHDGVFWRSLQTREIAPGSQTMQMGFPFFDDKDRISTTIGDTTYSWDGDNGWIKTGSDSRLKEFPEDRFLQVEGELPDEAKADSKRAVFRDNNEVHWFLSQRALHKAVPGSRVKVFSDDEKNPFRSSRIIREVLVDSSGTTFINTDSVKSAWFMLPPARPLPQLDVSVAPVDDFAWEVRLASSVDLLWKWQLDDEAWQRGEGKHLQLEGLSNGFHVVKIQGRDAELQLSPLATTKFEVKMDSERQLSALVQRLGDTDYERRESAMRAISRLSENALPGLRKARASADNDQGWWINAAIQEIEGTNRGK